MEGYKDSDEGYKDSEDLLREKRKEWSTKNTLTLYYFCSFVECVDK